MSMDGKHRSFQEQVEKQPDYRYDVRNEIIINNDTMIFEEEYNVAINKELIKDDLYEAVNGAWIKDAKIPDDKPATGGFNDLVDEIDKQMMADFEDYADGKKPSDDSSIYEMNKLYRVAKKFDLRK